MNAPLDFRRVLLPPSASVKRAIQAMTAAGTDIVLVAGADRRLLGIVVDSDLRKAILRGVPLESRVEAVMNRRPITLAQGTAIEDIGKFFQDKAHANVPLVDARGRVTGLARMADYFSPRAERPNWVVLLVGGEGRRLRPLTEDRPKPLLPVGNKPILETIIEQFMAAGFRRFVLAVNHHAGQIRSHFGSGKSLGAEIRYVQEKTPLGTAGPLSLLPGKYENPLIVMNGDLLTRVDFGALLRFHEAEQGLATVCVREYDFQVPYGVIRMQEHRMAQIVEKPTQRFFVNAGIYVLDPSMLKLVPRGRRHDMPQLLEKAHRKKPGSVNCFPIREYWIDIGQLPDYERAQADFGRFFAS